MHSPTKKVKLRDKDSTGNGWFGASRGSRKHKGTDFVVSPGERIYACISGRVRVGLVYGGSIEMKLVEIVNDTYKVQQMYVQPYVKTGDYIKEGSVIGKAQDVAAFHGEIEMKPHVHISVWKHGLLTDPEPLIIPCSCLINQR